MDSVTRIRKLEQLAQEGYSITVKVKPDGSAEVTLKARVGDNSFTASSGRDTSRTRYQTALALAVNSMLDYQFRYNPEDKPTVLEW